MVPGTTALKHRAHTLTIAVTFALAAAHASSVSAGEFQLGVYGGWSGSFNSDIGYVNSGNDDDFTMHDVPWQGLSFIGDGGAPYYGLRGTYWLDRHPGWGLMVEYTHAKVRATPDASVAVTGTVAGDNTPTSPATVSSLFDRLEFTDGLNLLTANAMYRHETANRFRPYAGFGGGVAIPNVEVTRTGVGSPTFEYQAAGWAAQVFAGVEVDLWRNLSAFGEYKLSYSDVDASLQDGGTLSTDIWTNHLLVGVAATFGGPN